LNADIFDDSPLFAAAQKYIDDAPARFHTPGHKGCALSPCGFMGDGLKYDLTELPETDSLFTASGPILRAEELAAQTFGTSLTLMSAGGATLCIQAMLKLVSSRANKIIMARNSHISAVNAAALLGLEPVWIWPHRFPDSSLPGEVKPYDVFCALKKTPEAAAVYITSPDYYGVMSDVAEIAKICDKNNVPLLVDNAHGAHLACLDGGRLHPLRLGAWMTCDSAHKTLPVLTGGAWLQIRRGAAREQAKDAMALFGSTSPSYPVMLSLDLARAWMKHSGAQAFGQLHEKVAEIDSFCARLGLFRADARFDPVRITIDTGSAGLSGFEAARLLRRNGVSAEMADDRHVVFLPSPFNSDEDLSRLREGLHGLPLGSAPLPLPPEPERPEAAMTPREALMAPYLTVPSENSAGRVSAAFSCPCPPGVPIIAPGERITKNLAHTLKNYGADTVKVVK
jgi:arginine/lysine/ornithine decarboxylase